VTRVLAFVAVASVLSSNSVVRTAAALLGVLLSGVVLGCASPAPSAAIEQVDRRQDGTFAVEIRTPRARYTVAEAIPIVTNFVYIGPEARTIAGGAQSLVTFGLEQIDGPLDMLGGSDSICVQHQLTARQPVAAPFLKSGGWSNNDPLAGFWRAYFADKELHLPAGSWRVTASLDAIMAADCIGQEHRVDASVAFVVE
jgi:hypothetical protein